MNPFYCASLDHSYNTFKFGKSEDKKCFNKFKFGTSYL